MTSYIAVDEVPGDEPLVMLTVEQYGGKWDGLEVDLFLTHDEALVLSEMLTGVCVDRSMIEES